MAASWVDRISPPGVVSYQEEEARGVWQGGNAAFMRNWPYAYSLGNAEDSVIKDSFAVVPLPKGGENGQNADTLGGWQMAVSKYSENVDAAAEVAVCMTSYEAQKFRATEGSSLPTIGALYSMKTFWRRIPSLANSMMSLMVVPWPVPAPSLVRITTRFQPSILLK